MSLDIPLLKGTCLGTSPFEGGYVLVYPSLERDIFFSIIFLRQCWFVIGLASLEDRF